MLFASQIRWTDPTTAPWIISVGGAVWLVYMAMPILRWWQRERVQEWPTTRGQIESATVREKKVLGTSGGSSAKFQAELAYSYTFERQHYCGRYKEEVGSEAEGWEFMRDLKSKTVMVSYNPRKPAVSVLTQDAIEWLLSQRPPAGEGFQETVSDAPVWMKPLLWPIIALSVLGMALSLWIHLGAIVGKKVVPEPLFDILQTGGLVVWFSAMSVGKRIGNPRRKNLLKVVLPSSPDWLEFAKYSFSAYVSLVFLLFLISAVTGNRGWDSLHHSWYWTALYSAYWMGLYSSALAIFYSAAIARDDDSKQLALKR